MRALAPLLILLCLAACCPEPEAAATGQLAARAPQTLHYFAGVVDGERSVLWRTDPAADDPAAARQRVLTVEHAAGYPARGAVSGDGQLAWLRKPDGGRHHDPAEVIVDGRLVDDAALYLQQPRFVGERLVWLRRWAGPERFDGSGRALQSLDGFDLLTLEPGGEARVVARWEALFVILDGTTDQGLLVRLLDDDGEVLLELDADGSPRSSTRPAPPRPEPQVRGEIGRRWEVRVAEVGDGVLWRLHGPEGLDFVLERPDGSRSPLVPTGDPAREVTLVEPTP